ncbi:hypothetical protein IP87_15640 [beta proteobacterium AAP121]|nr:hypothetical protein IP87_15640 [beta proteobacterium AAP121]
MPTDLPLALRLPEPVTEFIPAGRLAVFRNALDAFLCVGCPREHAAMAAAEVEHTGAASAVTATAEALPLAPWVAARFDADGDELAVVVPLGQGGFGLFLAAPRFANTNADVIAAQVAEAARLTGRPWIAIKRQRVEGFGPQGWQP